MVTSTFAQLGDAANKLLENGKENPFKTIFDELKPQYALTE